MRNEIIKIYKGNKTYYKKHLTKDHFTFLNTTFNWTDNLKEQIYCLRFKIYERPKCGYSKCDKHANFKGMTEGYGVGGCCKKHGQFITNLKKYGYEMPFKNKKIREKAKKTLKTKFGVDNPMKNSSLAKKSIKSRCKKNKINKMQQWKIKQAFQRLTRIEKEAKKPRKKRNEQLIREKSKATWLKKYGVENPMHCPEIAEKCNGGYGHKEYIWKTGEISKIQGFENLVLEEYENDGYLYNDIKTSKADMPEIWYIGLDGKKHRYFPDFYIPKENLIIEVKSTYTVTLFEETNELKFEAVKKAGFNFKLEVR